jgi:hypothetical protein
MKKVEKPWIGLKIVNLLDVPVNVPVLAGSVAVQDGSEIPRGNNIISNYNTADMITQGFTFPFSKVQIKLTRISNGAGYTGPIIDYAPTSITTFAQFTNYLQLYTNTVLGSGIITYTWNGIDTIICTSNIYRVDAIGGLA